MKTVVITGASRGIGLATARRFLDEGWKVIGTYKDTPILVKHERLSRVRYDQSNPRSIALAARRIKKLAARIDVLVNNAAVLLDAHDLADMKKMRATFEANLFGVIDLTERLLPHIPGRGRIINVSSQHGAFSFPIDGKGALGYRMSKASLNMYTRVLAFRLQPQGIIVAAVDPGWTVTDMGLSAAKTGGGPTRQPEQAAQDIYALATKSVETGKFWRLGKEREW